MEGSVEVMEEKWLWPVAMGKYFKNAALACIISFELQNKVPYI